MPTELLKKYIGLVCSITYPDGMGEAAELTAVDGEWIKLGDGEGERLVNTRLVRTIAPMPQKYQEKYQEKQRKKLNR